MRNIITYKVTRDVNEKLKEASKIACNFWNYYIEPRENIVIHAESKRWMGGVATSFKPSISNGTRYGRIKFKRSKVRKFTLLQIAGTMVHEIGHTLGFGWEIWNSLYERETGKFTTQAVADLPALADMEVERDHGNGTRWSHWDETLFDRELMSGFKDQAEHVLPVTIDVMGLMGHTVLNRLDKKTPLDELLTEASSRPFTHRDLAKSIDREHSPKTEVFEVIPHKKI